MTPKITCLLIISVLTCAIQAANYFKPEFSTAISEALHTALISLKKETSNVETSEEAADKLLQLLHKKGYSRSKPDLVEAMLKILRKMNFFGCTKEQRSSYRTLDGSCNNLRYPEWGMSFRPQSRLLMPEYDDGVSSPRLRTSDGMGTLPNPRTVSNVVHANTRKALSVEPKASWHPFQWGQFLDHDLISTPVFTGRDNNPLQCCENLENENLQKMVCNPIYVPTGDSFFKDGTCMNVKRSAPALNLDCSTLSGPRQQENQLTSYIDGSQVYGSSMAELVKLRNKKSPEYMAVSEGDNLPFNDDNSACVLTVKSEKCFIAGEGRANVVPSLASYHTLLVQEHNRIVNVLKGLGWTDPEELFQEARKILIAQIQHITYNEFLRWLLSADTFTRYGLQPTGQGQFFTMYDQRINTDIANDFGIAYRMGHSWIPNRMVLSTEKGENVNKMDPDYKDLDQTYFNPHMLFMRGKTGAHRILKWMSRDNCPLSDRVVEDSARNKLFLQSGISFDLAALNINRGRDHGIPPYWKYRVNFCGENVNNPDSWESLTWHTENSIQLLRNVYASPKDIDLWTGLVTEDNRSQVIGPTLNCILGAQFKALKFGDRYWYERPEPEGFSVEKLNAIKGTSLAALICANLNDPNFLMPQNAMYVKLQGNPAVPCSTIPKLDLSSWRK
ncbi:hypothetical protein ACJMK2_014235 [Sinanodonta woodiana]|uniref:Peroxidase n=1 Tax=Sinanodonta woodiana TaxID=1069815 RepID=A0ABD3V2Z1_SINWO